MTRARLADRVAGALLPLALAAVGRALVLPSEHAAASGDLVLAVLVVLTALGIDPRELWALHSRWKAVLALSLGAVRAARSARLGDQPPVRQPAPRGRAHPRTLLDGGRGGRPGRTGRWGCCARARGARRLARRRGHGRPDRRGPAGRGCGSGRSGRAARPLRARRARPAGRRLRRAGGVAPPDARRAVVRRRLDGCRGRAHLRVAQRHGGRRGSRAGARCERGVPRAVRSAGARLGTPGLGRPATPRWRSLSDYETSPSPPRSPHRHSVLPPPPSVGSTPC